MLSKNEIKTLELAQKKYLEFKSTPVMELSVSDFKEMEKIGYLLNCIDFSAAGYNFGFKSLGHVISSVKRSLKKLS